MWNIAIKIAFFVFVSCVAMVSEAYGDTVESHESMAAAPVQQVTAPAEHVLYHNSA